ncbi:hypothetical protein [Paractinoplanes globisporus]|uniref:DUF4173 domain-containing protein n=1 Tax=Paractinoplanes globisporus TaxID=113565 RepID=A0ABW6WM77_9ACTN|nr:hypothetical protein [Actinoplanes globisporus]
MTATFDTYSSLHRERRGCGRPGCDASEPSDVRVLCRAHGAWLVLAGIPPRTRYSLGAAACVLTAIAFFVAPLLDNALPIFIVLGAAGLVVVALPLRNFPVAGRSVGAGWVVACVLAFVLNDPHGGAFRPVITVIALLLALGWTVRLSGKAATTNRLAGPDGGVAGAALIGACLGVASAAGLLWLTATAPSDGSVLRLPRDMSAPLAWVAWLTIIFAALALGAFAAVRGTVRWSDPEQRLIASPPRPPRMATWENRGRSGGAAGSPMDRLFDGLLHTATQLVLSVADVLVYVLYYWTLRILVAVLNWVFLWVGAILEISARAIVLFLRSAANSTRMIFVPTVALLVAAVLTLRFSGAQVSYAENGSATDLGPLAGYAVAAYCLLTIAWTALSAKGIRDLTETVVDLTSHSLAVSLVGIFLLGWLFGILGLFGYGTYHIGVATVGCTVLIVMILVIRKLRTRFSSDAAPRHGVATRDA